MSNIYNGVQGYKIDNPYNTISHHNCDHKLHKGNPGNPNLVTYKGDTVTLHKGKPAQPKDVEVETLEKPKPNFWQKAATAGAVAFGLTALAVCVPGLGTLAALAIGGATLATGLLTAAVTK
jgi:hypothetical protein